MTPLPGWRQRDSFPASMATSAVSPGAHVGAGAGPKRKKFEGKKNDVPRNFDAFGPGSV